jgi:hypothetical protein
MFVRQMLYHSSHASVLFALVYFSDKVSHYFFPWEGPQTLMLLPFYFIAFPTLM